MNTYVITMPERKHRVIEHLNSVGMDYKIFPAFDKKMGLCTENPYLRDWGPDHWAPPYGHGITPPFFCGKGIQCLATSNYAIIKMALANNEQVIRILEDDIVLVPDWQQRFDAMYKALPADWLVFWGSHCCCTTIRPYKPEINLARGYPLCTPFMVYSRKAMEMIEEAAKLESPWDVFLYDTFCMRHPDQCFIAHPEQLASQLSITGALPTTLS